jgi:hypothetical protein
MAHGFSRNVHRFAGLSDFARAAHLVCGRESCRSRASSILSPLIQRLDDVFEDFVNDYFRVFFGQLGCALQPLPPTLLWSSLLRLTVS